MATLILKLVLTPVLVVVATLAGRRWGAAVGGWLVGLPLTSGPVVLFVVLDHGPRFGAAAAAGVIAGTVSQGLFAIAAGLVARTRNPACPLAAGTVAFAAATLVLDLLPPPMWLATAGALATLAVGLALLKADLGTKTPPAAPAWDLPARIVVTTALVLLLTAVSGALGPHLTGLIAPYPLYGAALAAFAQIAGGGPAARAVMRGLLAGLFGFVGFFIVLAVLLPALGVAAAFSVALAVDLAVQAASLALLRARPPEEPAEKPVDLTGAE